MIFLISYGPALLVDIRYTATRVQTGQGFVVSIPERDTKLYNGWHGRLLGVTRLQTAAHPSYWN